MHNKKKYFTNKPKDAASVIILRKHKKDMFVLMGRRPIKSKFMPGVYVFPGGALEKEDFLANNCFNKVLKPHKRKLKTRNEKHALAIFYAAVRETYEETGLYLSSKTIHADFSFPSKGIYGKKYYNEFLIPDITKLIYIGRAITPAFLKRRYHARFFLSFENDFYGKIKENGELENLKWINILEAKKINIADVTEFMLQQVINLKGNFNLLKENYSYPMFTWRNRKRYVKCEYI